MSFSYETFQAQQPQQDGSGSRPGAPPEQDATMGGQIPDNSVQQFQGGNGGDPVSAGGQREGGDAKTTLWYVVTTLLYRFILAVGLQCIQDGRTGAMD